MAGPHIRQGPWPLARAEPSGVSWRWIAPWKGWKHARDTNSIFIEAPVEKVYEYWADPGNWSGIAPAWLHVENKNIKRMPEIAGTTFESYGKMIPSLPTMKYSVEYLEAEPNRLKSGQRPLSAAGVLGAS